MLHITLLVVLLFSLENRGSNLFCQGYFKEKELSKLPVDGGK
jgi:hypothetical protein